MKTKLFLIAAAATLCIGVSHAQIPVTDAALIGTNKANFIKEMAQWVKQINHMKSQIDTMKKQFKAISGKRNLGNILNNPLLKDYLPQGWRKVYDEVKKGGYKGLSGTSKAIYDANMIFNACESIKDAKQKNMCEANSSKGALDQGMAVDAFEKATQRIDQIQQLMGKINETTDQKAIAELQGRIASEQNLIQNEMVRMQLYQMIAKAEDKIMAKRARESWNQDISKPATIDFPVVQRRRR